MIYKKMYNGHMLKKSIDPYNPLNLPPLTLRGVWTEGTEPSVNTDKTTKVNLSTNPNIWDITMQDPNWRFIFYGVGDPNLLEVLGVNTRGMTTIGGMFHGCNNLKSVALFDVSGVTNLFALFDGCSYLTDVPHFDTSHITSMSSMFWGCVRLKTIPLFDTSNVTDMGWMFYNSGIADVPFFDTSSVTNMSHMFASCSHLKLVPLFDTSSVINMDEMFNLCYDLVSVPLLNTANVTNVSNMFNMCRKVSSGALALYNQMSTQTTPPATHDGCFTNCGRDTVTGAAELAQIPSDWK